MKKFAYKNFIFFFFLLVLPCSSFTAVNIAIIDSGVDIEHEFFINNLWKNFVDFSPNTYDEDNNGYVDDIFGWNFVDNSNQVFNFYQLRSFSSDCYKFFKLQAKLQNGTIRRWEKRWLRSKVADPNFVKQLNMFGNFIHGTHVGGIAVGNSNNKILVVKLIPTKLQDNSNEPSLLERLIEEGHDEGLSEVFLIEYMLDKLSTSQMDRMKRIANFIKFHKMAVANCSFGMGYKQVHSLVKNIYKTLIGREGERAELHRLAHFFLGKLILKGQKFVSLSPNILYVFAAGNDKSNNDQYLASPANINTDNTITVAATDSRNSLARFSNFGKKTVHLAAPGVMINSSVPGDKYLPLSGTSQAAPYVAYVAGQMKELNPALTPRELKEILIKTVDYKVFLDGKVTSGGIVNAKRAKRVANIYKTRGLSLNDALVKARYEVEDEKTRDESFKALHFSPKSPEMEFVLPLPAPIVY